MAAADSLLTLALLASGLAAAGWASQKLRLPPALGYLAVGAVAANAARGVPAFSPIFLQPAADIAVLFLLFLIGLELDLRRLRDILRKGAVTLPLDVLVPALGLTAGARIAGWSVLESVALGLCMCLSSTLFGERLAGAASAGAGTRQRTLGILLAEDLAAGALLAVMALLAQPASTGWLAPIASMGGLLFWFVLLTAGALLVIPRVLDGVARTHAHDLVVLIGAAFVLVFGWLGGQAGSAELGALVAGVAAAEAGSRYVVRNGLQSVRDVALALFFFAAGLAAEPGSFLLHPTLILAFAALFLTAKLVVHVPAGLASGLGFDAALRSALALGTVGEFSLILAGEARRTGLAHPSMHAVVVDVMLVLLVAVPLMVQAVPRLVGMTQRIPERFRRPLYMAVAGIRAGPAANQRPPERRPAVQLLAANLVLLLAWVVVCYAIGPALILRIPGSRFLAQVIVLGLAAAVAAPIVTLAYRRYRELVLLVVGRPGEGAQAERLRVRLVDAWVAVTAALLLVPLTLLMPRALPVLLGGLFVAITIGALAWRQLAGFHRALEATVVRVLGQDPEAEAVFDHVLERYPWGVRFAAVGIPESSPVADHSIRQSRLTELTGATVAMIQRRGKEIVNPRSEEVLRGGDTVVLMGDLHQISRAEALVVAHGDALRLTAQSRLVHIIEVPIRAGSSLVGLNLRAADMRGRTGTLVVGVWADQANHPVPYDDGLVLRAGDRLILLGAPLQVDRARLLAEGHEVESTVETRAPAADVP